VLGVQEPFARLFTQGMITRDGAKMSKSKGNTVSPAEYVSKFGADAARCYICFMGPPEKGGDWSDDGIAGVNRFLGRLWRLCDEVVERTASPSTAASSASRPGAAGEGAGGVGQISRVLLAKSHWAIERVTGDFNRDFQFNTAISAVMELVNEAYRLKDDLYGDPEGEAALRFATATAGSLLFPFAPHLGAEIYELIEGTRVWEQPWPKPDPALLSSDTFTLVLQVNGKLRDRIEAPAEAGEGELLELARASEKVSQHIDGKDVVKEVVVPGKLVNIVVR
ncbi:MAG: leucyl-tRNA synthetase, partial [Solirubrobacterales bacterium]|nr:leucyl-tRNA synthetase [Solirubrobacterales bacterium]